MKQVLVVFKHEWLYFKTLDRIKNEYTHSNVCCINHFLACMHT